MSSVIRAVAAVGLAAALGGSVIAARAGSGAGPAGVEWGSSSSAVRARHGARGWSWCGWIRNG
jgi:hypothetical protein